MNDTRQRMKELLEANRAKRLPPEGKVCVTPAVAVVAQVRHRCGHSVGLAHYEGQECAECKAKTRQARAERRKQKQAEKPKPVRERLDDQGRLPDGTEVSAVYTAKTQTWKVALIIPGFTMFTATGTSLEMTERDAAKQYRETVKGANS